MSKSLGNFVTLQTLFEQYGPMTVRFFILQGHYRSPQDFSDQALSAAQKGFERLCEAVAGLQEAVGQEALPSSDVLPASFVEYRNRFFEAMDNDFATATALTVLFDLAKLGNEALTSGDGDVQRGILALFLELGEAVLGLRFEKKEAAEGDATEAALIDLVVALRQKARTEKDWAEADRLRDALSDLGIAVLDGPQGSTWKKG